MAALSRGKSSHGTRIISSSGLVIRPMSSCCGSSFWPGWPRWVAMIKNGILQTQASDVSGLTALPRPEFCIITTERRPPMAAPAAVASASPSLAEDT